MRSEISLAPGRQGELLDIDVSTGDGTARIMLSGDLDELTAGMLQRAVIDVLRCECPDRIDIDLEKVEFLDAAGIRALLLCRTDARQIDCRITLSNPRPIVYRVLRIVGLLEPFGLTGQQ